MRVLVIPDVHLKPWMFQRASVLMKEKEIEKAVCLMDIPDDFGMQYALEAYRDTYDAAIRFAKDFPETMWCYGNHDLCYIWNQRETGYSKIAPKLVCEKLHELQDALPHEEQLAYVHRIGNVVFSHGGVEDHFVRRYVTENAYRDIDAAIRAINRLQSDEMWQDSSPIWFRPQLTTWRSLYQEESVLQVVGHTPMREVTRNGNLISCDVFSLDRDRKPYGTQEYTIVDTDTWEHETAK